MIGSGLGLTMLTLLIAVQQAVERTQLGVATSLNQFTRAIGGAIGVALMGAVLTAGLATQLRNAAKGSEHLLTDEQAELFAANPNALIDPAAKASLPSDILRVLQGSMAAAMQPVFLFGAGVCVVGLFVVFFLPGNKKVDLESDPIAGRGEDDLASE
jgi:hypothetical protein